jgi:hypothetical protein
MDATVKLFCVLPVQINREACFLALGRWLFHKKGLFGLRIGGMTGFGAFFLTNKKKFKKKLDIVK